MTVGIGIAGAGVVGGTLVRRLVEERSVVTAKTGLDLEVRRVAVRDLVRARPFTLPDGALTDDVMQLVEDDSVQLVVEVMGGLEPAGSLVAAALEAGKPEQIVDRIVDGKMEKFYSHNVLLDQPFIKDPDKTVHAIVTEAVARLGENIQVRRFARFKLGEGLAKRPDDFAAEVAAQMG